MGNVKADSFKTDMAGMVSSYFGTDERESIESMTNFDITEIMSHDSSDSNSTSEF